MPLWFFIALLAPILWAFVNVADKYLVSHYRKDNQSSGSLALFSCLVALIACGLIAVFVHGIDSVSFVDRLILIHRKNKTQGSLVKISPWLKF